VDNDVHCIEAFTAAQGARNLFQSGHRAAEQHWDHSGLQSCDECGNVRDGRIDEDDFASSLHRATPEKLGSFEGMLRGSFSVAVIVGLKSETDHVPAA
jgi:hypothetical protein